MKLARVNQQPQGVDYEFNIGLNWNKPLRDEINTNCGSRVLTSITLDPYIHRGCLHIGIVGIQFWK